MRAAKSQRLPTRAEGHCRFPLSSKITAGHLALLAIIYVRQSSARQVRENVESTQLQYRLVELARASVGPMNGSWSLMRILAERPEPGGAPGFQRILAEVSLGHVGIVLGIEMSRLARSCLDWHHLLELCAMFGCLLGDADGTYDPRDHNDRLLLGLKGTMSEAELHILRGRLEAGRKNKAQRGEYFSWVPIGYVRTDTGVALEPDEQARAVVQLVFDEFEELGSAHAVLRYLRKEQILIGMRIKYGPGRGTLAWRPANRSTLLQVLHHPIYAGAMSLDATRRNQHAD